MSQHDFDITSDDAVSGRLFRAAVNAALQALASNNSGSSAPATTFGGMFWADTNNDMMYVRNAGNTAWVAIGNISAGLYSVTGEYAADTGSADAYAISLNPAPTSHVTGIPITFKAKTANTGAEATIEINSLAVKTLKKITKSGLADLDANDIVADQMVTVVYDGTYYQVVSLLTKMAPGAAYQDYGTNSDGTAAEWYDGVRKLLDAKGSMIYASAANTLAALAIGTAGKKLFVNADGDLPEWAVGMQVKTFTRDNALSSGSVDYELDFQPSVLAVLAYSTQGKGRVSVGFTDFTTQGCIYGTNDVSDEENTSFGGSTSKLINVNEQTAAMGSAASTGFSLTWTKAGSSTVTTTFIVLALR